MTIRILITTIICLKLLSCETGPERTVEIGNGIEIFLTETPYTNQLDINYSTMDFDTIVLSDIPMLRYNDIQYYDTLSHKVTLGVSHDRLNIGDAGIYGRMFVVTVDKQPIYCGFKWPVISSVPCNWVSIQEPIVELDQLKDNEIVISFAQGGQTDPRMDTRLIDRLKADGKIE
jgi:hypothetical protein